MDNEQEGIRLSDGSIVDPEIFKDLEGTLRSENSEEFQENRFSRNKPEDPISPFTADPLPTTKNIAGKRHEERSERAQDVDEQQNAPVAPNYETWAENKNRYDLPGVDTIPPGRQAARAEQAAQIAEERGAVDRVEQKGSAKNLQGKFSPQGQSTYGKDETVVRVQGTADHPERTLAHEMGHAIDYAYGDSRGYNLTTELFDLDTPTDEAQTEGLADEAIAVSEKARGDFKGQQQYRRQFKELTADIVGQAIIQPRATKRDAPNLFERVQEAAEDAGFGGAIPKPLANDPKRPRILDIE